MVRAAARLHRDDALSRESRQIRLQCRTSNPSGLNDLAGVVHRGQVENLHQVNSDPCYLLHWSAPLSPKDLVIPAFEAVRNEAGRTIPLVLSLRGMDADEHGEVGLMTSLGSDESAIEEGD